MGTKLIIRSWWESSPQPYSQSDSISLLRISSPAWPALPLSPWLCCSRSSRSTAPWRPGLSSSRWWTLSVSTTSQSSRTWTSASTTTAIPPPSPANFPSQSTNSLSLQRWPVRWDWGCWSSTWQWCFSLRCSSLAGRTSVYPARSVRKYLKLEEEWRITTLSRPSW